MTLKAKDCIHWTPQYGMQKCYWCIHDDVISAQGKILDHQQKCIDELYSRIEALEGVILEDASDPL